MRPEITSSLQLASQSSSDTDTCSHWSMTSTVPAMPAETDVAPAFQDAIDIIGHESKATDTIITKTRQEIEELKNRQILNDNIIKKSCLQLSW